MAMLKTIARKVLNLVRRIPLRRYWRLREYTGGLLRPIVYREIHRTARKTGGTFLEVGAASGAASIALAWGAGRLIIVEHFEGNSGSFWDREFPGASHSDNMNQLTRNLAHYGVLEKVTIYPHRFTDENAPEVLKLLGDAPLDGFMHDADGRLDRDFFWLWPRLVPGGTIIIDDYPESGDTDHPKKRRTFRMLNRIKEWGLFEEKKRLHDTVFGIKPHNADWSRFDRALLAQWAEKA